MSDGRRRRGSFVAQLARHGSIGQQRRFFSELLAGRHFASATLEGGAAEHRARLRRDRVSDGHRLDGQKFRVTGALLADWLVVRALDERGQVALACVERSAPGLRLWIHGEARTPNFTGPRSRRARRACVPSGPRWQPWRHSRDADSAWW